MQNRICTFLCYWLTLCVGNVNYYEENLNHIYLPIPAHIRFLSEYYEYGL